jgi:sugar/nucleoside kinase (ribokinase family)
MKFDYDIVILGDISLDWHCSETLSFPFSKMLTGKDEWIPIKEQPGGSGLLFASFAQDAGYRPYLVGKVGDDGAGNYISQWLQDRELDKGIGIVSDMTTGKVFIIHDSDNQRFLIANSENANKYLSISDIQKHANIITETRILYVSGHCFKEPDTSRIKATRLAINLAQQNGGLIIFDLVPHEFYKIYPEISQFKTITNGVNTLISEVHSIRRIFNLGNREEKITRIVVEKTIEILSEHFSYLILRYGRQGLAHQAVWDSQTNHIIWQENDLMNIDDYRGYGDKLTIKVLKDIWKI